MLPSHQLADALQVAITTTQEEYLLDNVVLVCCDVNQLRARSVRLILYMFCLHLSSFKILVQSYEKTGAKTKKLVSFFVEIDEQAIKGANSRY
jgi:hypothetical protein